jgi:hypothetical protein
MWSAAVKEPAAATSPVNTNITKAVIVTDNSLQTITFKNNGEILTELSLVDYFLAVKPPRARRRWRLLYIAFEIADSISSCEAPLNHS